MRIELIEKEQYEIIKRIQKEFPFLTFENVGYEYPRKPQNDEETKALETVSDILKDHIDGFSEFNNFRVRGDMIQLRFQYNWGYDGSMYFIGVGYIMLDELLNGFTD